MMIKFLLVSLFLACGLSRLGLPWAEPVAPGSCSASWEPSERHMQSLLAQGKRQDDHVGEEDFADGTGIAQYLDERFRAKETQSLVSCPQN